MSHATVPTVPVADADAGVVKAEIIKSPIFNVRLPVAPTCINEVPSLSFSSRTRSPELSPALIFKPLPLEVLFVIKAAKLVDASETVNL